MPSTSDEPSAQPHLRDQTGSGGLPIVFSLGAGIDAARMARRSTLVEPRVLLIAALAIALGIAAAFIAQRLVALLDVATNMAFQRVSASQGSVNGQRWILKKPVKRWNAFLSACSMCAGPSCG